MWLPNCQTENNWYVSDHLTAVLKKLRCSDCLKVCKTDELKNIWQSGCLENCQSKNVWVTAWLISEKVVLNNWPTAGLKISENVWLSQTIRFFQTIRKLARLLMSFIYLLSLLSAVCSLFHHSLPSACFSVSSSVPHLCSPLFSSIFIPSLYWPHLVILYFPYDPFLIVQIIPILTTLHTCINTLVTSCCSSVWISTLILPVRWPLGQATKEP